MTPRRTPTERLILCAQEAIALYDTFVKFREGFKEALAAYKDEIPRDTRIEFLSLLNDLIPLVPRHSQFNYLDYTDGLRGKSNRRNARWRKKKAEETVKSEVSALMAPESPEDITIRWNAVDGEPSVWLEFGEEIIKRCNEEFRGRGELERDQAFLAIARKYDKALDKRLAQRK